MNRKLVALAACVAVLFFALIAVNPSRTHANPPENCPISLTNPDGQSMALVKYDLRAAVHGALSLVEMEMTFKNSENRQMEGRFVYTLPPGATISRFAKEVNGKLMEGEVVERMRAQAIYTEILHTMRDPALLETDQGNRFSARVFPVPANGTVRLLLAFSQPLAMKNGVRKLTIPLAGLPKIGEFNFSAIGKPLDSEKGTGVIMDKEELLAEDLSAFSRHSIDYTPTKDIELTFKAAADKPIRALKAGNFQMVQFLYNPANAVTVAPPSDWAFYFDTSASGADTEAVRLQVIEKLLDGVLSVLGEKDTAFSATAFDIDIAEIRPMSSMHTKGGKPAMPEVVYKLRARHALGATNLEAALKNIGDKARANPKGCTYVVVSDGIPTWGKREANDLVAALGEWPVKDTLHALVIGNKQDEKILNAITEKGRGRVVTLPLSTDVDGNVAKAIANLRTPLGANFEVYDEGTAWIYPKSFHDVRPGQELIAFSEIKAGSAGAAGGKSLPGFVQRGADGKTIMDTQVNVAPVEVADFAPLLQREAYKKYLDYLEKQEQAEKDAMKRAELHKKRIEISVKNRVMCSLTSLLVLETERDYQRFGIERTALADVMFVGRTGIELRKRAPEEVPPPVVVITPAPPMKKSPGGGGGGGGGHERISEAKADAKGEGLALDELKDVPESTRSGRMREAAPAVEFDVAKQARDGDFGGVREEQLQRAETTGEGGRADRDGARRNAAGDARPHPEPTLAAPTGGTNGAAAAAPAVSRPAAPMTPPPPPADRPAISQPTDQVARIDASRKDKIAVQINTTQMAFDLENETLSAEKFSELRAKIQANPRDRKLRNAYADALLKAKKYDNLQAEVFQWLPFDPENPAVYEYLGQSATGLNDPKMAMRAYTSIAEIAPNRAALLARAGFLFLATQKYDLAETMFREALKNRQDDCNIYRGLALSLWLGGNFEGAAAEYETALMRDFNARYGDTKRVLREELAYVLRAWRKKEPAKSDAIVARAQRANVDLLASDALRVTMCWETDANDVDLHVIDPNGEECFYQHKNNTSGLELYSDQTQGLGPEVIRTTKALPGTYLISVNYFNAGPMGVSRGVVVILKPVDGVDENPRVVPFALIEGGRELRHIGSVKY